MKRTSSSFFKRSFSPTVRAAVVSTPIALPAEVVAGPLTQSYKAIHAADDEDDDEDGVQNGEEEEDEDEDEDDDDELAAEEAVRNGAQQSAVKRRAKGAAAAAAAAGGASVSVSSAFAVGGGGDDEARDDDGDDDDGDAAARARRATAANERLVDAVRAADVATLEAAIAAGANVNAASASAASALHFAAFYGSVACMRALLRAAADVNKTAIDGSTPLHWCVNRRHTACARALLAAGADVRAVNLEQQLPLHRACLLASSALDIVRMLVDAASPIDAADKFHRSPLHLAVAARRLPETRIMLERAHGVVCVANAASTAAATTTAAAATTATTTTTTTTAAAAATESDKSVDDSETVKRLLDAKNAAFGDMTLLHHAVQRACSPPLVAYLVRRGADVGTADAKHRNALHWAAFFGHETAARVLMACVRRGAENDRAQINFDGINLLTWRRKKNDAQKLIKALTAKDTRALTPIDVARQRGHAGLARLMQQVLARLQSALAGASGPDSAAASPAAAAATRE